MPERKMVKAKKELLKVAIVFLMTSVFLLSLATSVFAASEPEFGNVAGGNTIDVRDVVLVMRKALEMEELTFRQCELADVNNDGVIDILDVTLIMRKALNIIDSFPVEDVLEEDAHIIVSLYHDQVFGFNWPEEEELTIKVGALEEKVVTEDDGSFEFRHEDLDIKPGQAVVVSTGALRKVHVIRDINITSIDRDNNLIRGTVEAGSTVEVRVFLDMEEYDFEDLPARFPVSNNISRWIANFNVATGNDKAYQAAYVIDLGDKGHVQFVDLTNDATVVFWECQESTFSVVPEEGDIYGGGWAPVSEMTVTIGDNEYTVTSTPVSGLFTIEDITVKAGDTVVVTDGVTTLEHEVTDLTIESAYSVTKIVIGSAARDSEVEVSLLEPVAGYGPPIEHEVKTVTTNTAGTWFTAFNVTEITENMSVRAVQYDENNNSTIVSSDFDN